MGLLDSPSIQTPGEHPLYSRMSWWWEFFRISWLGGDDYLNPVIYSSPVERTTTLTDTGSVDVTTRTRSMLWSHPAEENDSFLWRLKRARYANFCAPLLRARLGHVLGTPPVRVVPAELAAYLEDTDGAGLTRDAWMSAAGTIAQWAGHVFAVTEVPSTVFQPRNAAEARAAGQGVYSTLFSPLDVPNWALDDRGEFIWIVLRYQPIADAMPFGQQTNMRTRYRVWYRDRWEDWEATGEPGAQRPVPTGETGPNPIGRVPVDVLYNARNVALYPHPIGVSAETGIAEDNRAHFNLTSLLDEQLYEQTFASLAVPADSPEQLKAMVRSVKRVMGFSSKGGAPLFISPPSDPTRVLMENIDKIETRMRAMANLSRGVAEQSASARSGEALAFESAEKWADLRQFRTEMQSFEERNLATAAAWVGVDASGISVRYHDPEAEAPEVEAEAGEPAAGAQPEVAAVPERVPLPLTVPSNGAPPSRPEAA